MVPPISQHVYHTSSTSAALLGHFSLPEVHNEPMKTYAPNSVERIESQKAIKEMQTIVQEVPCIINGQKVKQ
jgi:1-pyrroline-5-carboxylate dehydrogenase